MAAAWSKSELAELRHHIWRLLWVSWSIRRMWRGTMPMDDYVDEALEAVHRQEAAQ